MCALPYAFVEISNGCNVNLKSKNQALKSLNCTLEIVNPPFFTDSALNQSLAGEIMVRIRQHQA